VPILATAFSHGTVAPWAIVISSLALLAVSGAIGASIGGGHRVRAALRVFVGGGLAMAITALIGHIIGTRV
jgi:VIT1/CCC1 family predicted Fe2+/Mn2+ transporter